MVQAELLRVPGKRQQLHGEGRLLGARLCLELSRDDRAPLSNPQFRHRTAGVLVFAYHHPVEAVAVDVQSQHLPHYRRHLEVRQRGPQLELRRQRPPRRRQVHPSCGLLEIDPQRRSRTTTELLRREQPLVGQPGARFLARSAGFHAVLRELERHFVINRLGHVLAATGEYTRRPEPHVHLHTSPADLVAVLHCGWPGAGVVHQDRLLARPRNCAPDGFSLDIPAEEAGVGAVQRVPGVVDVEVGYADRAWPRAGSDRRPVGRRYCWQR